MSDSRINPEATPIDDPSMATVEEGLDSSLAANRNIDTRGRTLREHSTRGILINSAFQVGFAGINLVRRFLIAAFLTQAEYGLWGILLSVLITLTWLKQVGIADKYIQQNEGDQEAAYQKAFTLELFISLAFFALSVAVLPLYAAAYGYEEILLPGILLALAVPISAFETPIWIATRNMQFLRQRVLASIDPLVAFALTVVLGVLGYGYWALIAGALAGCVAGGLAATITSPYRLRLRFDRETLRDYTRFSWPLAVQGIVGIITIQGALLAANGKVGLAGVAAIGLTSSIASFSDRVNGIVSQTIYPAVCIVADRRQVLYEAFVKSNRVVLMWAIPFSLGLALFSQDLITYVIGEHWRSAEGLLIAMALIVGATQIAFNWTMFFRALNDTTPLFFAAALRLIVFGAVLLPALLAWGLTGYIVGLAATVVTQVALRGYFLSRLFKGFKVLRHSFRAIAPSFPAVGAILALRLIGLDRTPALVIGELALYAGLTVAFTVVFERNLLKEMWAYLRGSISRSPLTEPDATQRA